MSNLFLVFLRYYFTTLSVAAIVLIVIFIADGVARDRREVRTRSHKGGEVRAKVLVPSSNLYGKTKIEDISLHNPFLYAEKLGATISVDFDNQYIVFSFDSEQNARNFVDIAKRTISYRAEMRMTE